MGIKYIDLAGQKFGRWLVISLDRTEKKSGAYWLCRCDCNNEKVIWGSLLRRGKSKSCGCYRNDISKNQGVIDLTNQKFGRWTVIGRAEKPPNSKSRNAYWLCVCECNNEKVVSSTLLRSGQSKSCGCLHREISAEVGHSGKGKKKGGLEEGRAAFNKLYGRYKGTAKRAKREFLLSIELFEKIVKSNCYYCGCEPNQVVNNPNGNGNYVYNGIDRLDNKLGYLERNVVPCCQTCNRAKLKMGKEEFLAWIEKVYNHSIANKLI